MGGYEIANQSHEIKGIYFLHLLDTSAYITVKYGYTPTAELPWQKPLTITTLHAIDKNCYIIFQPKR